MSVPWSAAAFRMILTPIDTVKTTLQVQGSRGTSLLRQRIKINGLGSLWWGAIGSASATFVGHYPWFAMVSSSSWSGVWLIICSSCGSITTSQKPSMSHRDTPCSYGCYVLLSLDSSHPLFLTLSLIHWGLWKPTDKSMTPKSHIVRAWSVLFLILSLITHRRGGEAGHHRGWNFRTAWARPHDAYFLQRAPRFVIFDPMEAVFRHVSQSGCVKSMGMWADQISLAGNRRRTPNWPIVELIISHKDFTLSQSIHYAFRENLATQVSYPSSNINCQALNHLSSRHPLRILH